ncbi:MAG: winged helix-turn-helix domain-containing protein [Chloroflexi bacterium]|nr:winged helix-turn-helix domain-containing protein [Chloroflexota bacterium]
MTENLILTNQQARRFLLAHQGLWPSYEVGGKAGIRDYVRRVGCIQFDPLNIVGRNPDLVLQARFSDFRPEMLQELLYDDRYLVDGWDKNMSIYSVEDWPYFRRRREAAIRNPGKSPEQVKSIMPQLRQEIKERGPLSSIDLDFDQTVDWSWAPTRLSRAALESAYFWGELVIHHKVNTRKVYDFASNHIPAELLSAPEPNETEEQYHDWYVLRRIGSVGLMWNKSGDAWLAMPGIKSKERKATLARLIEQDKVLEVRVQGIDLPLYMRSEDSPILNRVLDSDTPPPRAVILAPLDNLIWDRRFIEALFDFYYVWEVYKPVVERRYGYYVLPILYGDRFVARFEPGRDKKSGACIIKNWWWEEGITPSEEMLSALRYCFRQFLGYLGTDDLQVDDKAAEQVDWLVSVDP